MLLLHATLRRGTFSVIVVAVAVATSAIDRCGLHTASAAEAPGERAKQPPADRPNIVLLMADDLGWGDVGYNGNRVLRTPNLDAMAREGLQLDRWYSAAPVCSPTRGSCLTGRHPYRYGIPGANAGHLPREEVTLAEVLRPLGYATGHFGKWHLGTLTKDVKDGRRGGRQNQHYAPPWEHGFDECFSTEQAVPTFNPLQDQKIDPTRYWTGPGKFASDHLEGDDSRVIMDRAVPFIQRSVKAGKPFFAVVWFHAPHSPVVAGPKHRAMYAELDEDHQHYYGCITALDEQVGRLRSELSKLGVAKNTLLWFSSDNGPAARGGGPGRQPGGRQRGTAGPFRDRKGSLHEGGVRVPGLVVWPARIKTPRKCDFPGVTSDYFPTVLAAVGQEIPEQRTRPYDGLNLLPMIDGTLTERPSPIAFQSGKQRALGATRYKIYSNNAGHTWQLYDLLADRGEQHDLAGEKPEVVKQMTEKFNKWKASCAASARGEDYSKNPAM